MMYNNSFESHVDEEHTVNDEPLPGNWSNATQREIIDLKTDAGWPFLIGYTVIVTLNFVAGNVGNVLVIGAVLCDKNLRKAGNLFIVNLAVADLCVTGFVEPFFVVGVFVSHEWFLARSGLCHVIGAVCLVSCVCSLWSIAAISVNRYVLLCKPALYPRIFTWKRTSGICACLWLGAMALDLPNFLGWGDHTYDMKIMACAYDRLASYSYTVFFIMMFVTIPLFTVLFCNIKIYVAVVQSKIRVAAHSNHNGKREPTIADKDDDIGDSVTLATVTTQTYPSAQTSGSGGGGGEGGANTLQVPDNGLGNSTKKQRVGKHAQTRKNDVKLAKTLFIIFIVFCVCWTPYALLCLIDKNDVIRLEAYAISVLLAHASSSLNSILYAVTNKSFRDGFALFLQRCGCPCFVTAP